MKKRTVKSIKEWKITGILFVCAIWCFAAKGYGQTDASLKVQFTFNNFTPGTDQVMDDCGHYTATLENGAGIQQIGNFSVLSLGSANGYLDLGKEMGAVIGSLEDFTAATYIYIDETVDLNPNGNFIWSFSNSNDVAAVPNGQMFLSAKTTRYAITQTNWTGETMLDYGIPFPKGLWKHVTYTQSGSTGTIYIDGVAVKTGTVTKQPGILGETAYNYIGRSPYIVDAYLLKTMIYDFRIYDRALSAAEVLVLNDSLNVLNQDIITDILTEAKEALVLDNPDEVISDLTLPKSAQPGIEISWVSSVESAITSTGSVTRPPIGSNPVAVQLTATLAKAGQMVTKAFFVTVLPYYDDRASVERDSTRLTLSGELNNLRTDIALPLQGSEGSAIAWISDRTDFLTDTGQLLQLSAKGSGQVKVLLTATITKGSESAIKVFEIYIAEDEAYAAYLFAYFTGNSGNQEAIRFGLSSDGFNYRALNNNAPILSSAEISMTGGVRDPHILRGVDGQSYYMVVTDMVSANGWNSNHGIVLLKSTDLVNWTSSPVDIKARFPEFSTIDRAWAPQTIYDPAQGRYMVYFSLHNPGGRDIIHYAYANEDFTDLASTPAQLYSDPNNSSCIDADIIVKNGKYYLFHKNETGGGIYVAISDHLTGGYELVGQPVDQTTSAVEGSCVFRLINSGTYVLMYDEYTSGTYQFTTGTDLLNFSVVGDVSMNFSPRHGTVMPVTRAETDSLARKWGKILDLTILSSKSDRVKRNNIVVDQLHKTVYLPVRNGTDLNAFDPELTVMPGVTVTPDAAQDFTQGPVLYTVTIEGVGSEIFEVTAHLDHNPLLDGYYADPEVLHSKKTGKYYIYPTSDGFTGWSGTYFKVFSSDNLTDWQDEGVILDLPADVSWASTNAWAPTILEKMIGGEYKYFYYFCAAQKIGVAVADDPTGPFVDSGQPLIASAPSGAGGQQIDPDVFDDPASGKTYLYWGNGYMARAELNPDMVSINTGTVKVMTPNSTYREGTEVFFRNGKYYFLWSENDTRSADYRVRYATSDSPEGKLTIPANNLVIAKDNERRIYGTGHNCVLYVPDSSKWFIIYHRFTRPDGIRMGSAAGYNREVCIDELQFNEDGAIMQVRPSIEGFGSDVVEPAGVAPENKNDLPAEMGLYPNYPNPFNPTTMIRYTMPEKSHISLKVYDLLGREVKTLIDGTENAGNFCVLFDGSHLSSGLYFYQLRSANFIKTEKMMLLK
ncbi:family 43 glycosylhydrolase [bacterium]|nr:family 43 glycosylhydrolase [bacterium]